MSFHKTMILGNLSRDPELKRFENGGVLCNFSVAVNDIYINKSTGEKIQDTEWYNVVVSGPQAESCAKYLSKGSKVFIEGRNKTRSYQTKEGEERKITELKSTRVVFVSSAKNGGNQQQAESAPEIEDSNDIDDLPF